MSHRSPPSKPQFDPHHDLADAPAEPEQGGAAPTGVQDRAGARPIDRIQEPGLDEVGRPRPEPGRVGGRRRKPIRIAVLFAVILLLAGVAIGAFVMQRPVPTLGLAAIACGMLLLFAAPVLTATAAEPAEHQRDEGTEVPAARRGPPTPKPADD